MSLNNCVSTLSNVASEWQFVCVLILGPAEPKCLVWLVLEVFDQISSIYCIFWLPSVTDSFNPNNQFPDQICYSNTLLDPQ